MVGLLRTMADCCVNIVMFTQKPMNETFIIIVHIVLITLIAAFIVVVLEIVKINKELKKQKEMLKLSITSKDKKINS